MTDYTDPDLQTWERIQIFNAQHGDNAIRIGHYFYYADGAIRDVDPAGVLQEPLPDPLERSKMILRYFDEKLRIKVKEFDTLKEQLLADENSWSDADANQRRLTKLQQAVRRTQKELDAAQAEYNKHDPHHVKPPEVQRRARMRANTEIRRKKFRDSISAIEI
ncbi:MAG: hypothetical protein Tsb009_29980 [Planctomycetaceae bacterium]